MEAQHGEPPTGVLLQDARAPIGQGDSDDDVRLRPAERRREVGRRLTEDVGRRLDAGQHEVGSQLAERLRERERRRPRVVRVDLARVDDDHPVGPTRVRQAKRRVDPVRPQPHGGDRGAGGLLDQHRLFERLVVELVDHHLDELAIDVGAALVDLELVTHLRHQPYRDRDVHPPTLVRCVAAGSVVTPPYSRPSPDGGRHQVTR